MQGRGLFLASLAVALVIAYQPAQATSLHLPHFFAEIFEGLQALTSARPSQLQATHLFTQTASSAKISREAGLVLEHVPRSTQFLAYSKAGPSVGMKENAELIAPAFANPDGAWLGGPQAALVGDYEGQKAVVLLNLDGPVYKPSEDRLTYAAVHTLPLDSNSLRIAGGAVNTFLAQHLEADSSGEAPLLLTAADIKDSLTLSDVSLYIDAAFVPSKQPIRRWLQSTVAYAPAPGPAASRQTGPPALPAWFAPGGPGNPVSRDNPTVIPGAPLPGYAEFAGATTTTTAAAESAANTAATLTSLPEAWAPGPEPGLVPMLAPMLAPAPGPAAAAVAAEDAPAVRGENPVLCMTAAGPSNCETPAFGANGVGSLGGPANDGSSTSASGWSDYGYQTQARSYLPSSSAYSVNRYQPRGGVWGPYHGSVNGK